MNANIPSLTITATTNGLIELEQQNGLDEPDRIEIHPLHLRYMAEKMGLVRDMSATEVDALRMVDKLARRIRLLSERVSHLGEYLALYSDSAHADLSYEQTCANATADLADEFVREIEEAGAVVTPRHAQQTTTATEPGKVQLDLLATEDVSATP